MGRIVQYPSQTKKNVQYPCDRSAACFAPVSCWPHDQTVIKKVPVHRTKEQVRDLFKSCDLNGDGKLSKDELKAAFKKLGSRCSSFRAGKAIRYVDVNGDGVISNEELNDLVNYAQERGYKL